MAGLSTGASGLYGGFTGLLYGSTGLSTPPGLLADAVFGGGTTAGILLGQESAGMAIDFTATTPNMLIRSTNSLQTNYYSGNIFGNPFQTTGPVAFSRASSATVVDSDGKIKWAAHNLLTYSEQLDNTNGWSKTNTTISANNAVAPDGTTTAEKLVADNGVSLSIGAAGTILYRGSSLIVGAIYSLAVYAKAAEFNRVNCYFLDGTSACDTVVSLADGSVTTSPTFGSVSVTAVSNGWYRIVLTITASNTGNATNGIRFAPKDAVATTGNGTSGIYLWGAHLYRSDLGGMQANASAYPMYNPTTAKNLLGYTEAFDNAAWVKTSSTVIADSLSAPNGLNTADTLTASSGTVFPQVLQATPTYATAQMVSVYAKAGTYGILQLFNAYGAAHYANFNLSAGVVGTKGGSVSDSGMVSLGNGWYRCWAYFAALDDVGIGMAGSTSATKQATWAATGSETIYLYGAMLSDSASLDPYVPNHFAAPSAAAYHGPRLDYDPSTLAPKGLLVEEQRTNVLLHTAAFDNAPWTLNATGAAIVPSLTASAGTAPDGTSRAYRIQFDCGSTASISNRSSLTQGVTISNNTAYRGSIWIKAYDANSVGKTVRIASDSINSTVYTLTNSWVRVDYGATSTSTTANMIIETRGTFTTQTADVLIWGAQLEAGSFATSYIPTTSASVTRSADVASVSTQAFPYSSTAGTYIANFQTLYSGSHTATTSVVGGDASGSKLILYIPSGNQNARSYDGSTVISPTGDVTGPVSKASSGYNASGRTVCLNGGTVATGTVAAGYASVSTVNIGGESANGLLNGWFRQLTYIPRLLTNAEQQSRTA